MKAAHILLHMLLKPQSNFDTLTYSERDWWVGQERVWKLGFLARGRETTRWVFATIPRSEIERYIWCDGYLNLFIYLFRYIYMKYIIFSLNTFKIITCTNKIYTSKCSVIFLRLLLITISILATTKWKKQSLEAWGRHMIFNIMWKDKYLRGK